VAVHAFCPSEFSGRADYDYHQQITAAIRDKKLPRRTQADHGAYHDDTSCAYVDVYAEALRQQELKTR